SIAIVRRSRTRCSSARSASSCRFSVAPGCRSAPPCSALLDAPDRAAPARPRRWPVRVGLALVVAIYLAYSSFGIAAPFLWGHHGYHGATYMQRAKMTLRFHMLTPATWAGYEYPI